METALARPLCPPHEKFQSDLPLHYSSLMIGLQLLSKFEMDLLPLGTGEFIAFIPFVLRRVAALNLRLRNKFAFRLETF